MWHVYYIVQVIMFINVLGLVLIQKFLINNRDRKSILNNFENFHWREWLHSKRPDYKSIVVTITNLQILVTRLSG